MLSVITPVFNQSASLPVLHERLSTALSQAGEDWEWIVVDDHSSDATGAAIEALRARDRRVRGIRLTRSQGTDAAIVCGLDEAKGDAAALIAGHLQDPPESLGEMLRSHRDGAEIVWAVDRRASQDAIGRVHEAVLQRVVGITETRANAGFFLIDRRVIDAVRRFRDRDVGVVAVLTVLGFRQGEVAYERPSAAASASPPARLGQLWTTVTAFSNAPLRAGAVAGLAVLAAGVICFLMSLLRISVAGLSPGWILLLSGILIVGGLNLTLLGVIGEYVWRLLRESPAHPRYVVERRFEG